MRSGQLLSQVSTPRRALASLLLATLLAPPALAQRDSSFMRSFQKAVKAGDVDMMAAAIEGDVEAAVWAIVETCELISEGSSQELEADVDALGRGWRKAFSTSFVENQYEYYSFLGGEYKRSRKKLVSRYQRQLVEYETKDRSKLPAAGVELLGLSGAFEEVGDAFMAGVSAGLGGRCFDADLLGPDADLRRACEGLGRSVRFKRGVGLPESLFADDLARFDRLEWEGYGDPSKGPEARARERAEADPAYAPAPLGAAFELVDDIERVARPIYGGDGLYALWDQLPLGANGSTQTFPAIESSPTVIREGAAKAGVDLDGDGEIDVEVPVSGALGAVEFELGRGDEARRWGFLATVGMERDTYQGVAFNMAPSDGQMSIYVAPAASIVGMIGETRIQIFDDNMDGRFGSPPIGRGLLGTRPGAEQLDVDSILIGESKRAQPWSELVQVGEAWYRLVPNDAGSDLTYQKWDTELGTLKLSYKGPDVDFLVMRGLGNLSGVCVDLAEAKKGVQVPTGSYELLVGSVSEGKRNQKMKALILAGEETPSWKVAQGETVEVELGAPFGFDFDFSSSDEAVTIRGNSVQVVGSAGEVYGRLWNCVPRPEASVRKAGSRKGGKAEKMRPADSQEESAEVGYEALWFPFDKDVPKKAGEDVEVQLVEKKHKLFGKIESEWKAE